MRPTHILTILDREFASAQHHTPVMLWGPPGVGKSQMVAHIAALHSVPLIDIRLSQMEPTDLRGIPFRSGDLVEWSIPAMLPPFGNVMVDLLKNTSLVSLVTVSDLTFRAGFVRNEMGHTTDVYLIILVIYFVLSQVISAFSKWLERRFALDRVTRSVAGDARMQPAGSGGGPT